MSNPTQPRLPGGELVERGLADLRQGRPTREALLVSRFAERLAELGIRLPVRFEDPDRRLYELLAATEGNGAHSAYNALTRRIVSYLRAAERARRR